MNWLSMAEQSVYYPLPEYILPLPLSSPTHRAFSLCGTCTQKRTHTHTRLHTIKSFAIILFLHLILSICSWPPCDLTSLWRVGVQDTHGTIEALMCACDHIHADEFEKEMQMQHLTTMSGVPLILTLALHSFLHNPLPPPPTSTSHLFHL